LFGLRTGDLAGDFESEGWIYLSLDEFCSYPFLYKGQCSRM